MIIVLTDDYGLDRQPPVEGELMIDSTPLPVVQVHQVINQSPSYSAQIYVSGGVPPYTYSAAGFPIPVAPQPTTSIEWNGLPSWLTLNTATGALTGQPQWNTANAAVFNIKVTDSLGATATQRFFLNMEGSSTSIAPGYTWATPNVLSATVGVPFSQAFVLANGSPSTNLSSYWFWQVNAMPWIQPLYVYQLTASNPTITGTPWGGGTRYMFLRASNFSNFNLRAERVFEITVQPGAVTPTLEITDGPVSMPDAKVNTWWQFPVPPWIVATANPVTLPPQRTQYTWTAVSDDPLSIGWYASASGSNPRLQAYVYHSAVRASDAGTINLTVSVQDDIATGFPTMKASRTWPINILPPDPLFQWDMQYLMSPPAGTLWYFPLQSGGGWPPLTWRLTSGALPDWLPPMYPDTGDEMSASRWGTPPMTEIGIPYSFDLTVTDAKGNTSTRSYTLTVDNPAPLEIGDITGGSGMLWDGFQDQMYNVSLNASGGVPPYYWGFSGPGFLQPDTYMGAPQTDLWASWSGTPTEWDVGPQWFQAWISDSNYNTTYTPSWSFNVWGSGGGYYSAAAPKEDRGSGTVF
jgi:hypothetical protein